MTGITARSVVRVSGDISKFSVAFVASLGIYPCDMYTDGDHSAHRDEIVAKMKLLRIAGLRSRVDEVGIWHATSPAGDTFYITLMDGNDDS